MKLSLQFKPDDNRSLMLIKEGNICKVCGQHTETVIALEGTSLRLAICRRCLKVISDAFLIIDTIASQTGINPVHSRFGKDHPESEVQK